MQAQTRMINIKEDDADAGYVEIDPTRRYGRFDAVLGKGAMKTVYRAFDEVNGMEVAWNQVKLCDVLRSPDALERMYSEVHVLSTLRHDSIIRFHASWVDGGKRTFNFITEMFTSGTLREYRQRHRRVDIRAIKNWACQILHGLVYLHSHDPPVIHRDLKCDNIFVNGHLGQVKIGDLGLAAVLRGSQSAHSVIGTPEFMAPELYEEEYNELVDIYSFGMCVLEMLTAEYPYSECSNPAQIYKKVTAGKLPDAFYRIQDSEARRFIGRCLEIVSKRPSAEELLSDPFLIADAHRIPLPTTSFESMGNVADDQKHQYVPDVCEQSKPTLRNDMTITGKMNPEDDTIFLKVQIGDKDGHMRNIYFPFDILSDTPMDVANEMVKELEITDRDPEDIAEVIAQEISTLVPKWNGVHAEENQPDHHVYNYEDDVDDGNRHPFYYMSSPNSSYQESVYGTSQWHGIHSRKGDAYQTADWLGEDLFHDDNGDDTSSMQSGKYSSINYCSGNEHEHEAVPSVPTKNPKSTKFSTEECHRASSSRGKRPVNARGLTRNRSFVDLRSQLLHRTLVEELSRRHFKTVGAVENIGFQMPCGGLQKGLSSSGSGKRDCKMNAWGRG